MDDWPLVGRGAELGAADEAQRAGRSVVLAGEAGVGKSRLAAAIVSLVVQQGLTTLRVVGSESAATIPFGALAPIMPRTDGARDPLSLLQSVGDDLRQRGDGGGVLLWVDDAHLLDPGSATLVQQLVVSSACTVVGTIRRGEACPDAIEQLWRNGDAALVEVAALGVDAVHELLEAALGPPVARSTTQSLWRRTQGNPLYLREMVRAAILDDTLSRESGAWLLRDGDTTSLRLVEFVRRRLEGLGPDGQAGVELLALGDELSPSLLDTLVPGGPAEELEARGVVTVRESGRRVVVRLAHPLYGEVARAGLSVSRRRRLHAELAAAVNALGARRREDVLQTATWSLDSDEPSTAEVLLVASTQAQWRFDLALAERFARAALAVGGGVKVRVALAEAVFRQGRGDEALSILATAAAEVATPEEIAEVADARAHVLNLVGRPSEASAALAAASASVPPALAERLDSRAAVLALFAGRVGEALDAVDRLLAAYSDDWHQLPELLRVRCDYVASLALALAGRYEEAERVSSASFAFLTEVDRPRLPAEQALIARVVAYVLSGRFEAAEADARQVEQALIDLGDAEGEATGALLRGRVALATGDCAAALAHFARGSAVNRTIADPTALRWTLAGEAMAHALVGDAKSAARVAGDLEAVEGEPSGLFEAELVQRGLAWADVAVGRYDSARERLTQAAAWAGTAGQTAAELLVRHDLLRLGDRGQAACLVELAGRVTAPANPFGRAVALAAQARSGAGWEAAAEAFDAIGARVEAMEAFAAAVAAYRSDSESRRANGCAVRLASLASAGPTVRTPGLVVTGDGPVPLTAREREIATLAAEELSAQEIADRLFLSRRTVENHLQRIYTKLGINSRTELERELRRF